MKIAFMSDSHGSLHYFQKTLDLIGDYDYLIHCGDLLPISSRQIERGYDPEGLAKLVSTLKNIYFIEGNGDFYSQSLLPEINFHKELFLTLGNYNIYATHGHLMSRMSMLMKAESKGAHILSYGHSHIKELDSYGDLLVLNPGSISLPRDGSPSYAILEKNTVSIYEIESKTKLAELKLKY